MAPSLLVLYGSYRSDRVGIRLARFLVEGFAARGARAELVDAREVGLPMLDRMYKEHPPGTAPAALEALAAKIRGVDAAGTVVLRRKLRRGEVLVSRDNQNPSFSDNQRHIHQ
jgi:NAD(P)H-dependent FMN reductase